jgi:hypothetical protein
VHPRSPGQAYNRTLSDVDRQIVEEYLAAKYANLGLGGPHAALADGQVGPADATNEAYMTQGSIALNGTVTPTSILRFQVH